MVVAMKELSIRGDFRTTVEYLIKLLETESFRNNDIDTGWLDHLIAEKVQVWTRRQTPPHHYVVIQSLFTFFEGSIKPSSFPIGGETRHHAGYCLWGFACCWCQLQEEHVWLPALTGTVSWQIHCFLSSRLAFKTVYLLSRGQVLPAASLLNSVNVDLIYEGVKYCLKVSLSFWSFCSLPFLVFRLDFNPGFCPAGSSSVPNNIRHHYEWLQHRDRRPQAERWRSSPVLWWQQSHHLHERGGGQARAPNICLSQFIHWFFFFLLSLIFLWIAQTPQLPHHCRQQDLHIWEGERPHGAEVSLCWQTAAVFGGRWKPHLYRRDLCRDWGEIDFTCPAWLLAVCCLLYVVVPGDEDGDDTERAAVWMRPLCQEAWSCSEDRLYLGPYGAGWSQQCP